MSGAHQELKQEFVRINQAGTHAARHLNLVLAERENFGLLSERERRDWEVVVDTLRGMLGHLKGGRDNIVVVAGGSRKGYSKKRKKTKRKKKKRKKRTRRKSKRKKKKKTKRRRKKKKKTRRHR